MSNFYLATLATIECAEELALLHDSLRAFHPPSEVPLVVGCSSELMEKVHNSNNNNNKNNKEGDDSSLSNLKNDSSIKWIPCLDQYGRINRREMERQRGVWYPTRHCDFMMEKANVMDLALQNIQPTSTTKATDSSSLLPDGVLFVDSDICFFSSLYDMKMPTSNSACLVGVSPHEINPTDEAVFGRYNGGMLFAAHPVVLWHWRRATHTSRYFDQASIEDVVREIEHSEGGLAVQQFQPNVNYGFWRMFQSGRPLDEEAARFSVVSRSGGGGEAGIKYRGLPLQSVHTHFFMKTPCREVPVFNQLVRKWIREVRAGAPGMYRGLRRIL